MKIKNSLSSIERLDSIMHLLEDNRHITVETICNQFKVSPATARRDLDMLNKQGFVRRVHGGATALRKSPTESPVFQRMSEQQINKRNIGIAAASIIGPGQTVFLGSGTTVYEIAKNLKQHKELTVISNSLLVINELISCENITLIALGGIVRQSEHSMIGSITDKALEGLNAGLIFMGIHGIDLNRGLTNHFLPETMTDRHILQMGGKVVIVADHTKCEVISTSQVAPISVVDTLVTDPDASEAFVSQLRQIGINVIQA